MSTSWEDLVSTALVGADRRSASPGEVLEQAAVEVVRARAGRRTHTSRPPAPAMEETRPLASRAAGDRLARMLGGEQARLLPEWLEAAAAVGVRVPAQLIPGLLDLGARDRSIRSHLGALSGARGRWLAELNSSWQYLLAEAAGVPSGDVWEFGTSGDRRAYLTASRAADPGQARELLEQGWDKETPEDRAAFVLVLSDGLGMDDEPFLEAALDDRRREVRQAAADLLTRLPESRLARRMTERSARLLVVDGGGLRAEPPKACDSTMERDGVRPRPPAGTAQRGWWLQQVIARTPLAFWTVHLGRSPEDVVRSKIGDWAREVAMGWTRAAILQHDPRWARALFEVEPLTDLLAVLPPEEQSARAAELVARHPVDGQMIMMLGGVARPWGPRLAKAVLKKIVEMSGTQPWNAGELIRLAGERLDPAMHGHVQEIPELAATLRFRHDMSKELS
ncbi:DUF5691 domain-containing protein [Planotetraspora kaengkrachanensis]|uniref:Uncharacterized protein n=1 Tax=Planotetraspora kaengkrachanensis TaxID=575193 RepID=A0A8J3PV38_9ACTN|nr:DUF5691 domain-containing protein [Planotetraspora kaengkrachanensis]GIG81590.1 hypothetical protein Pka01_47170 [Planotetraspora kaengkrachanensis]